jgi:hypothetical protein
MSNHPSNKEQNVVIELTPEQQDPGRARPEDFQITSSENNQHRTAFHGQHGETPAEYRRLLAERESEPGRSKFVATPERNVVPSQQRMRQ